MSEVVRGVSCPRWSEGCHVRDVSKVSEVWRNRGVRCVSCPGCIVPEAWPRCPRCVVTGHDAGKGMAAKRRRTRGVWRPNAQARQAPNMPPAWCAAAAWDLHRLPSVQRVHPWRRGGGVSFGARGVFNELTVHPDGRPQRSRTLYSSRAAR